ncbi:vitamin B12 ABC transporter permease BtuC [Halospeciosus flavus]|uniref:Cobalamin import system permease protein BtuC n=1 Tax=Halospeciosus flavus TaxID=3032283 RepID=A0ABD5Z2C6_9EURY|nr:vitamin B12 ABC transporter permease BtuC [Halospeciosus flavus]
MFRPGVRIGGWVLALSALLVAVVLVSATIGPVQLGVGTVAAVVWNALPWVEVDVPRTARIIVMQLRLPRITLGAVVGFGLAAAGTVMQGFFRNPMADPSIIGVSSGAAVGAVAVIVAPFAIPGPLSLGIQTAAFCGALVAAAAVYLIATKNGRTPVATLLLAGVAVQTFLGAVISFMLVHSGRALREAIYWLMGSLHAADWSQAAVSGAISLLCFLFLAAYARDLNVLLLGEEDAHSLGVSVERTKVLLLALASLMTAAAVAVAGVIGFVGLVVPHVMRLLVGPDHRILLPTSALAGASFLVVADTIARSGAAQLPVGIVTAFVGAPFFLYLLRKREVHEL